MTSKTPKGDLPNADASVHSSQKHEPDPPKFRLATDVGPDADAAALAELSRSQLGRFEASHAVASVGIAQQVGQWHKPPGFEAWSFVRLLPRNHPNERARAANDRLEYDLKQFGYQDAPNGTNFVGAESDGQFRRWLCCPPDVKERWDARKRAQIAAQNAQKPIEKFRDELDNQHLRVTRWEQQQVAKTIQLRDPHR